jgi:hypothetical protein
MTTLGHDASWWSAVAAVGQVLGAIATFMAVVVSLWIVRTDRSLQGKGHAGILVIFAGDGSPGIYLVGFRVENTGIRDFMVQSIGWRVGWSRWGPRKLSYAYAIQTSGVGQIFENRWIRPTTTETFQLKVSEMKVGLAAEGERGMFFKRRLKLLGWAPIRAYANVSGRKPIRLKVDNKLREFLRTGSHADNTAG